LPLPAGLSSLSSWATPLTASMMRSGLIFDQIT
jgi:hypothetical protein